MKMKKCIKVRKVRLDELSLAQFIDVAAGEFSVLDAVCGSRLTDKERMKTARRLVEEYSRVTDPAGYKSSVIEKEDESRLRATIFMLGLLEACLLTECPEDDVREVLVKELGRGRAAKLRGEALTAYVTKEKRSAEFRLERMNADRGTPPAQGEGVAEDIRRGFDSEIAFVMAYFKMGIDVAVIRASVYANLVRQARAGAKELAKMKKS